VPNQFPFPQFKPSFSLQVLALQPFALQNVSIGEAPGPASVTDSLLVSWDILKQWGSTPDTATISIHNLEFVSREVLAVSMSLPTPVPAAFNLGWAGGLELVFSGQVWRLQPKRVERTDVITVIELGDGVEQLGTTPPAGGASFGLGIKSLVQKLLISMGIPQSAAANARIAAAAAALPIQAFQDIEADDVEDKLDVLLETLGLNWGIADGQFVVFKDGVRDDVLPALLAPNSGLLTWHELDDGGAELVALAQPRFVPGMQITVYDELNNLVGGGPLRVESVRFSGNSEGSSLMNVTARKLSLTTGAVPLPPVDVITGA
jgi:hypothetical protein